MSIAYERGKLEMMAVGSTYKAGGKHLPGSFKEKQCLVSEGVRVGSVVVKSKSDQAFKKLFCE